MGAEQQSDRELLLAQISEDVCRVKVIDDKGAERWRDLSEGLDAILPTDEFVVVGGKLVTMKSPPGRRPKPPVPKMPKPATALVADLVAAKQYLVDNDPLLAQLGRDLDNEAILYHVMQGFAEEAVSLQFERREAERTGEETSAISMRRVTTLGKLGDLFLKRKELLANRVIDLDSPAFTRLFNFMLETFRESMLNGGVPRDQVETVFTKLSKRLADETWGSEARSRMKGS
jgi:hypothetical protein